MAEHVNSNLDISSATIGISQSGLEKYREDLQFNVIEKTKEELRNYKEIVDVISSSWNGYSAQKFVNNFDSSTETACAGLDEISKAIDALIYAVQSSIVWHDQHLIIDAEKPF